MIKINLILKNWFHNKSRDVLFKTYYYYSKSVTVNKTVEVQLYRSSPDALLDFGLHIEFTGVDHGGASFEVCVYGYSFSFNFRDNRHWDDDNDCWCS